MSSVEFRKKAALIIIKHVQQREMHAQRPLTAAWLIGHGLAGLGRVAVVHSVKCCVSLYRKLLGILEELKNNSLCGDHVGGSFRLFVSACL